MNKSWDDDKGGRDEWIKWLSEVMKECLRVLKPGAHALVWSIPRTSHWTTTAIENAGFEIRDVVTHLFGSGFPKSHDISKGIDKHFGVKREILGVSDASRPNHQKGNAGMQRLLGNDNPHSDIFITAPSTPEAKEWSGWGTALKPAAEFWILARKPLSEKTVAKNVLKWGSGGINIDGSRIDNKNGEVPKGSGNMGKSAIRFMASKGNGGNESVKGRFPANLILSCSEYCTEDQHDIECAIKMLDEQSGKCKSSMTASKTERKWTKEDGTVLGFGQASTSYTDSGGASRFFYCAKVSSAERNAGLDRPQIRNQNENNHPTVKALKLMSYLIKLITPPNGIVLDPFMGSGSTGLAAKNCGFEFIGIEKEQEYFEIAEKRIMTHRCKEQ